MIHDLKQFFVKRSRMEKRLILMLADAIALPILLWVSLSLGINHFFVPETSRGWFVFPLAVLISVPVFIKFGLYRAILRYFRSQTISTILLATLLSALTWAISVKLFNIADLTKSGVILYWLSSFAFISASRLQVQKWLYGDLTKKQNNKNVYIYGSGAAGSQLATLLENEPGYIVKGFIDDDPSVQGWKVMGIEVKSFDKAAAKLFKETEGNTEVIIAMPSASHTERQIIIERLEPFPVKVRAIPAISDFASGNIRVSDIQDIDIDDLLGRDPVSPDKELLPANISNKVVMITGAGGSIGSELCRQVVQLKPTKLILLELSEFALYKIEQELDELMQEHKIDIEVERILGSCGDKTLLNRLFEKDRVQTIYHAAAYKHVPLVEENPVAGLNNNIFGTKTLAEMAMAAQVETFILISTDKAVRPTNIMGCSKRTAEMVLQALAKNPKCNTVFSMVRFGNVLGSSGSVVPKFRKQIEQGGPITVTHKEITRYFMSIPEAVQLVIQAGAMATGGDVFVLDMGESVKITELATKMIHLSGLTVKTKDNPGGAIAIEYTGLRPGEKLYEELLIGDNVKGTKHPRIMQATEEFYSQKKLQSLLENLKVSISGANIDDIKDSLTKIVDGYTPWETNSKPDKLSKKSATVVTLGNR